MKERFLVVNYKAYPTAFREEAVEIARKAAELAEKLSKTRIILAVPAPMTYKIASIYEDLYLQHLDPLDYGAHTGYIPAEAIRDLPVRGTLINHSEHKIPFRDVAKIIDVVRKAGKEVIACADTPSEAAGLAYLKPDMIAVEPPELIGTGIPVSKAKPEVITRSVEAVHRVDPGITVLAGAGISSPDDAVRAVELGARGVLVASIIMKSKDPAGSLEALAYALEKT
ncbi:MAG: triose-phosphate isomerase [Desulfurococcales archaeon]|nr:triose-phosphate isomerase [Desulfurococcales archaeon]